MDKKMLNTIYEFELADGSTAPMTLSFYGLYKLRGFNKALYERYNKIITNSTKGNIDELDSIAILYTAYVCANMDKDDLMSEEDFIMLCGCDRTAVGEAVTHLISPKKAKASGNHSN